MLVLTNLRQRLSLIWQFCIFIINVFTIEQVYSVNYLRMFLYMQGSLNTSYEDESLLLNSFQPPPPALNC